MRKASVDIGVNWVCWLREQAAKHYIWDDKAQYHRVLHPRSLVDIPPARTLRDAWQTLPRLQQQFPDLRSNLFVRQLNAMPVSARARISAFFTAQGGLRDFEFLDFGGRAIAYRARHIHTGQMRVARMEAAHSERYPRPRHATVEQPFISNEGHLKFYGDIKLEIMPERLPLNKVLARYDCGEVPQLKGAFYRAIADLAAGINLMHGPDMFDRDAEPQNVALCPDGRLVNLDPEIVRGSAAWEGHRDYITPSLVGDANAQQLALIYPTARVLPKI